jgi:hypothetical protein
MLKDFQMCFRAFVRPPLYYVNRLFGSERADLHDSGVSTETLFGGGKIKAFPFFFRPGHLGRIQNSTNYKSEVIIEEHFHREHFDLYPLRICRFNDAWLIDGSMYLHGTARIELRNVLEERSFVEGKSLLPGWPVVDVPEAVLGSGAAGSTWFGHWLEDELPLQILAKEYGPVISLKRPLYAHELPYLDRLGLVPPKQLGNAHFDSLIFIDEFAQNPHKVRRFLEMRNVLASGPRKYERLYIRRGRTGVLREIRNEPELHAQLVKQGYGVVDLENCSFNEMHEACRQARIIVGVEGSHLAHALFMSADHACIVILNPPNQVHTTIADLAPFCRLSAAMFVGSRESERETQFTIDVDELLAFIDDAESEGDQRGRMVDAFLSDVLALAG